MTPDPFPSEPREVTITPVHIIGVTYCPTCWADIEAPDNPEGNDAA